MKQVGAEAGQTLTFGRFLAIQDSILRDGQFGSIDIPNLDLEITSTKNEGWLSSNWDQSNSGVYPTGRDIDASDYIRFSSANQAVNFEFQKVKFSFYNASFIDSSNVGKLHFTGYDNGEEVGKEEFVVDPNNYSSVSNQEFILTSTAFQNVDEVRISLENINWNFFIFNDIVVSPLSSAPQDVTPPNVALSKTAAVNDTATFEVVLDEAGDMYYVVTESNTPPTANQIINGKDHTDTQAFAAGTVLNIDPSIAKSFTINDLAEGKSYFIYAIAEDAIGNRSAITQLEFAGPSDTTPPNLTINQVKSEGSTAIVDVTVSEASRVKYVVTESATAPSKEQILQGKDQNNAAPFVAGDVEILDPSQQKTFNVANLVPEKKYFMYAIATDTSNNTSTIEQLEMSYSLELKIKQVGADRIMNFEVELNSPGKLYYSLTDAKVNLDANTIISNDSTSGVVGFYRKGNVDINTASVSQLFSVDTNQTQRFIDLLGQVEYKYIYIVAEDSNGNRSKVVELPIVSGPIFTNNNTNNNTYSIRENEKFTIIKEARNATSYQWQVRRQGDTEFKNIIDDDDYAGTATSKLTIKSVKQSMHNNKYRVVAYGALGSVTISNEQGVDIDSELRREPISEYVIQELAQIRIPLIPLSEIISYNGVIRVDLPGDLITRQLSLVPDLVIDATGLPNGQRVEVNLDQSAALVLQQAGKDVFVQGDAGDVVLGTSRLDIPLLSLSATFTHSEVEFSGGRRDSKIKLRDSWGLSLRKIASVNNLPLTAASVLREPLYNELYEGEIISKKLTVDLSASIPMKLTLFSTGDYDAAKLQKSRYIAFVENSDGTVEHKRVVSEFNNEKNREEFSFEVNNKSASYYIVAITQKPTNKIPYIKGYDDQTFKPNAEVTRTQIASMFARVLANNEISELPTTYSDTGKLAEKNAIELVTKKGLFKGDVNGKFNPNASITRAQMAGVAARFIVFACEEDQTKSFCEVPAQSATFTDVASSHWAADAIATVNAAGIMNGTSASTFNPNGKLTRVQAVKVLNRLFERTANADTTKSSFSDVPEGHWAVGEIEAALAE